MTLQRDWVFAIPFRREARDASGKETGVVTSRFLAGLLTLLVADTTRAATTYRVDLAGLRPGEPRTVTVSPGNGIALELINRLPNGRYNVTVLEEVIPIAPFEWPSGKGPFVSKGGPTPTPCEAYFATLISALESATEETEVPVLVQKLRAEIDAHPNDCTPEKKKPLALIERTTEVIAEDLTLNSSQRIVVTVERIHPPVSTPRIWQRTFATQERGKWNTSYGLNFIPSTEPRYFSKVSGTAGEFTITRESNRRKFDFAPSVYFSWQATKQLLQDVAWGMAAGLGFDLEKPIAFLGPAFTYNWNLSLITGVVMHQERRLRGQYQNGQTIRENLSSDALTDQSYRPAWFVGLSYRFGSNPFPTAPPSAMLRNATATATPTRTPTPTHTPTPR